jgi:excisionase family DNA binding protein
MAKRANETKAVLVAMAPPPAETVRLGHSIDSAAEMIDCSPRHIRNLIARGRLEAVKLDGRTVVLDASIKALIAAAPRVNYADCAGRAARIAASSAEAA